jgi:hypothetical protein
MYTWEVVYFSSPVENEMYSLDNYLGTHHAIMHIGFVLTKDVYATVVCQ